jgi:hypothetical protein
MAWIGLVPAKEGVAANFYTDMIPRTNEVGLLRTGRI